MSTPWEIRNIARNVHNTSVQVRQESTFIQNQLDETARTWSGDASKALRSKLERIAMSIRNQQHSFDRLEERLNRLAGQVQRADDERELQRRLAAEQAARDKAMRERVLRNPSR